MSTIDEKGVSNMEKEQIDTILKKYNSSHVLFLGGSEMLMRIDKLISSPPTSVITGSSFSCNSWPIELTNPDWEFAYAIQDIYGRFINKKLVDDAWKWIEKNTMKDEEWTKERNKDLKHEAFVKYVYRPEIQRAIVALLQEIKQDIILARRLEKIRKEKALKKLKKEKSKFSMDILSISHRSGGEGDSDPFAKVKLTDKNNNSCILVCRNIFDFGFVINLPGGGLLEGNKWQNYDDKEYKWKTKREATDVEIRAARYLEKFPPIYNEIRM